jgi:hypothetical protein
VTVEASHEAHRLVPLEGCFNFRDVGGYATADGLMVRWRRLFRAGGPFGLTDVDVEALTQLRISTIIDLRTHDEASERGQYQAHVAVPATRHLPMTDVLPSETELASWSDAEFVGERYYGMLTDATAMIGEALTVLADPAAYPVLLHCSAGKDRTGILVALVLGLVRVRDDDIVDDYALSGPAMRDMLDWLRRAVPESRARLAQHAPAILSAEPTAMRRFIGRLRADYGSFEGFARAIGADATIPYLRGALLA